MAAHMSPLPTRPAFPVFGLRPKFDGYRWLVLWNDHDRLYSVTLGHGDPESGLWLAVTTVLKTPRRRVEGDLHTSVGPTGYGDAVMDAVTRLAEFGQPNDPAAQTALIESEAVSAAPEADEHLLSSSWQADVVTIDGRNHACKRRCVNGAGAVLVDLSNVAISVTSPDWDGTSLALAQVNDDLDRYV